MSTLKKWWLNLRSAFQQRPGTMALSGLLIVVVTPFVIFPEIMGDSGVTDAGPIRNWSALVLLIAGIGLAISGAALFVRQMGRRRLHG